jgi:DNA-binding MarR family transcriptional regulator
MLSAPSRPRSTLAHAPVRLTPRDLALLEDVADRRRASVDQLAGAHFSGLRRATALKRLSRLVNAGYLARSSRYLLNRQRATTVYAITPEGRAAVETLTHYLERTSHA